MAAPLAEVEVTGFGETSDGDHHAFSWTRNSGLADLGTLGRGWSEGTAISATGQIVVVSILPASMGSSTVPPRCVLVDKRQE
jgi:probable HAF family extracellular repeat protein